MKQAWKVLIADDEPIIREGVRDSVDWESLCMKVVGEAEDGEEALELCLEHAIDILLVDINMPIMNGLTLIKHIREHLPECKIVIITGHDEFPYAQEAIRMNVEDYILKPTNPDQLQSILKKLSIELDNRLKKDTYLKTAYEQISKNMAVLRERFGLDWIQGHLAEEEIINHLEFLHLPVMSPKQLGIIRWPEYHVDPVHLEENDRQLFLFALNNIISDLFKGKDYLSFRESTDSIVICLWDLVSEEEINQIETAAQVFLKLTVNVHFETVQNERLTALEAVFQECRYQVFRDAQVSPVVRRARQFIRQNYENQELSLEWVADILQVSPGYLSRVIKQELGVSFISLVTKFRINKAIQLLNSTDLTILEIAECVGYVSQHYFSTVFKKVTGVSPNQYKHGAAFEVIQFGKENS
ncbi:response regulator [Pullulanibacillus sp. KACC 23026]|uniref:response regulator transcription factor n=1 Tax=Pullulanibacillus sp. KACC 23026 TaxID=3028315 RepID=UPI0023AEF5EF|nr:response regulator [Pullulanibacillus sp. KACC 23026]WEG12494.1 response regulator [Pullulanibacillus sp. KACC 23026]